MFEWDVSRSSAPGTADRRIGKTGKRNTQFDGTINLNSWNITSKWDIGVAVRRALHMYWFCQLRQISCLFCMPFAKWDERCCWDQFVQHRRLTISHVSNPEKLRIMLKKKNDIEYIVTINSKFTILNPSNTIVIIYIHLCILHTRHQVQSMLFINDCI